MHKRKKKKKKKSKKEKAEGHRFPKKDLPALALDLPAIFSSPSSFFLLQLPFVQQFCIVPLGYC